MASDEFTGEGASEHLENAMREFTCLRAENAKLRAALAEVTRERDEATRVCGVVDALAAGAAWRERIAAARADERAKVEAEVVAWLKRMGLEYWPGAIARGEYRPATKEGT